MNIIRGSGNNRTVFVFPDASIVNSSPEAEQIAGRKLLSDMLGVPDDGSRLEPLAA